jgi:hypothetical protein
MQKEKEKTNILKELERIQDNRETVLTTLKEDELIRYLREFQKEE